MQAGPDAFLDLAMAIEKASRSRSLPSGPFRSASKSAIAPRPVGMNPIASLSPATAMQVPPVGAERQSGRAGGCTAE
ncbi:hypothetical protein BYZ73_07365 [Rhodovulum viride]|uniref:Uncharacterized protein n=1 Tax=Rhodovulum viride TaxID=1231134 RepID=A0ABX9DJL7_9RHOB|nr:hypothetical protein BYZ73_07365 [Rhodovulum viride]